MAPEGIAVIGLQADLGFLPPPEPSLKPKAEERQSVEEPAGEPAADPKARTSRIATSPRASDSDDDASIGGATPAPGRTVAAATRPLAAPDQGRAPGAGGRWRPRYTGAKAPAARAARQRARQARAAVPRTGSRPREGRPEVGGRPGRRRRQRQRPRPTGAGPSGKDGVPAGQAPRPRRRSKPGGVEPGGETPGESRSA
ncbi:translation initiation factor IF-2-like [Panicum virgatum]|uniref:translation initiation factor IF-2-like n=1 Tax=Panicum virgatum TaxID=38727 RepID=UPI0019D577E3|nr:translation initiation factor IF-2-like [Panicum virgatum]